MRVLRTQLMLLICLLAVDRSEASIQEYVENQPALAWQQGNPSCEQKIHWMFEQRQKIAAPHHVEGLVAFANKNADCILIVPELKQSLAGYFVTSVSLSDLYPDLFRRLPPVKNFEVFPRTNSIHAVLVDGEIWDQHLRVPTGEHSWVVFESEKQTDPLHFFGTLSQVQSIVEKTSARLAAKEASKNGLPWWAWGLIGLATGVAAGSFFF